MSRTPLSMRELPNYSRGNEIANMVTHIVGAAFGVQVLLLTVFLSVQHKNLWGLVGGVIYGVSLICLYTVSSVYHGLRPGLAKKVMQVIDHCMIYFLIAGTYTPILLSAIRPLYPTTAWVVFGAEWGLAAFAAVFTAIDHKKYAKLSMFCYIGMGWFIIFALRQTLAAVGLPGFMLLLSGGISYTFGAILYGIGSKRPVYHTVFHIFVVFGSVLQATCILLYVL